MRHTILAIAVLSVAALSAFPAQAGIFGRIGNFAAHQLYKPNNPRPSLPYVNALGPANSLYCNSLPQRCGYHYHIVPGKDFQ